MRNKRFVVVGGLLAAVLVVVTARGAKEADDSTAAGSQAAAAPSAADQPSPTAQPSATAVVVDETPTPQATDASSPSTKEEAPRIEPSGYANAQVSGETTYIADGDERYDISHVLPRDAILAIFEPVLIAPEFATDQYRDTDLVIGVSINGDHRAYNVAYLSSHEVVNDVVGGKPVAVTW